MSGGCLRTDMMKAMKRKDVQIQKLKDVCAEMTERIVKLEAENAKLKKKLKK
jgi:regulator of replication initiation timing